MIPTKITTDTTSLQGIVGKEVTLKADINVKQAGVAVTFNVKADDKLNKDQVVEAVTNAEGIATYSYTQYAAGNDDVAVYPTGAPSVRSLAKVYWGVDSILTIVADDKKGDAINNGENKVYKVTYKDAKTGKAVANQKLHVTFAENVDTTIDKITHATVNGKNPSQLTNGKTEAVTVTTNSNGEATLTVSGLNTKATPVVFLDDSVNNRVSGNERLEATELQAKAAQLVIGAVQSSYAIEVTRDGKEEAATGLDNGRKYKVVVKDKDGKVAANETVNVSFNEVVDRNMNTNTSAVFTKDGVQHKDATNQGQQLSVKLNAKGEGSFTIATAKDNVKEYATPVVWIDINSSNAKTGTLDEGEPTKVADITYFAKAVLSDGVVKAYNAAGEEVEEEDNFAGDKSAFFKFTAANQSGNEMPLDEGYDRIEASFTVWNTGSNDVKVNGEVVSPNRSTTVTIKNSATPTVEVVSVDNKTTSVRVEARGTAEPTTSRNNRLQSINLGSHTAKASFVSTKDIGVIHTGIINSIDVKEKEIEFVGKTVISYKGASFKNVNAVSLTESEFVKLVEDNLKSIKVTVKKDGDKVTFEIVSLNADLTATLSKVNSAADATAVQAALVDSGFVPAFADLNPTQKTALATALLAARGNEFTETGLKNAYATAYATQVTAALADVASAGTATAVATALGNVPGLNLTAYKALLPADQVTVSTGLVADTSFASITVLEGRILAEIAKIGAASNLAAVNNATTTADALAALKALTGVSLVDFDAAPARVQQLVLDEVVAATFVDVPAVNALIRTTLITNQDAASVGIVSITSDFTATPNTLTFVFSDAVDLPATIATADMGKIGLTFEDGNTLGTGAAATYAGNTLTVTLGADHNITTLSVLEGIVAKDVYGLAIDLTAKKADGTTLITPVANLKVQ